MSTKAGELQTFLSNGSLTQVVNNFYRDGLLIRREYRSDFDSEPELLRTLEYNDMGQFVAGETIDPSVNEVISTESRVYAQNGWVTTVRRGPSTTRTTIELDDQGQITRIQESTGNGIGSFLRVTTQSFDESNSRLTERRFRGNGELIRETQFSNFVTIDDVVQDRLYQWEVFFDPSNF